MKPQQVEYWCLKSEHMRDADTFQSDISIFSHSKYRKAPPRDPALSPSECVWIIPYVNPWLLDWG